MKRLGMKLCALTFLILNCFIGGYEAQNTNACSHLITSRATWGARPPKSTTRMNLPAPNVLIHHADTPSCSTTSACIARVKGIQTYHMDSNGWDDIGYSFLVGGDGKVYEGRGWDKTGAHSPGFNDKSIGICLIGNFTATLPPQNQLNSVKNLISCGTTNNLITGSYSLYGHRDVRVTDCPGNRLYQEISTWPNKQPPLKNRAK